LSDPKPNVFFDAPEAPLSHAAFNKRIRQTGVVLHPKSRLLFAGERFFINGEAFSPAPEEVAALRQLADRRRLAPARDTLPDARPAGGLGAAPPCPPALRERLYEWYEAGWLEIGTP
jgi:50S ribosomal protein L16 3-hydroxylase